LEEIKKRLEEYQERLSKASEGTTVLTPVEHYIEHVDKLLQIVSELQRQSDFWELQYYREKEGK
jgi:predicted DNA-binding protein